MGEGLFLLALSFVVIIAGAELFTNGVEWLGVRLRLSEGAVGSVLAAVGTALPETTIPLVALMMFREAESHEVGLGAILGAPFMLATLGFFMTAGSAWVYRRRRAAGPRLQINRGVVGRDLGFFIPLYSIAISAAFLPDPHWGRRAVALGLVVAYAYYVYLNLRESEESEKREPLILSQLWAVLPLLRPFPNRAAHEHRRQCLETAPRLRAIVLQVAVALALIMGGAYKFVDATRQVCLAMGLSPLLFALIVAPIATELPEKLNSVIWVRQSRDTLSLGNIAGAMVFQSTFPVSVGMLLTPWHFASLPTGDAALLSAAVAVASAAVVLVAVKTGRAETISPVPFCTGMIGWLAFVGYVAMR